jgi:hypothetical protein
MTATELGYFRNIIKYCRSNISLTGDPACVAANDCKRDYWGTTHYCQ